ncbi:MAG: monooxygenase [Nevskiaceae bacterium]|nr:MAG: monooxygenase [Nevskiaceae bacterium]TBR72664.1 MAG: monooxygenase [Nevskiaceae bacterium]
MPSNVFLVLQSNDDTRAIVDAIEIDNPKATITRQPAMVRIDAPNRLVVRRETVEEQLGNPFDLQAMHVNLVTLGGNVEEDADEFALYWDN